MRPNQVRAASALLLMSLAGFAHLAIQSSVASVRALRAAGFGAAEAWDGERPLVGPRPWRETCTFAEVRQADVTTHVVCLRQHGDPESDEVRALGRAGPCDSLVAPWNEVLLPRKRDDLFLDAGAGSGACSLFMAARGAETVALETRQPELFRLTSGVLANALPANVTVIVTRSADALFLSGRRVRLMRVPASSDARAVLDGARALFVAGRVRSVLLEAGNGTALVTACTALETRGFSLSRGGKIVPSSDCAGGKVPIVANLVV